MKKILLTLFISVSILSCKKDNNYDNDEELCKLLSKMKSDDQRIRKMDLLKNGTSSQKDSLWRIQKQIDKHNTELLIEITEKRGWVSKNELGCDGMIPPVVIFRHSPKEHFEKIKELIETEYNAGRIGGLDYTFIENHLKGRPDFDIQIVE
ncbi:hypothetical protein [Tenacibaculum sp. SG-28]|uniref:hypothetical protein n=1 Tax=Tenacibaculum sp. SG-28 TaxID=754426 RepID=UPI000CF4F4A7|nr:hypothetical protein [Tenacibaculum sp. SG-28]PQJ19538.1 hypothetical protein BSU00_12520 [Tenacibaculum sp. SG-28]